LSGRLSDHRTALKEHAFEIYQDEERGEFVVIEARKSA
jgi:hypothetical protein